MENVNVQSSSRWGSCRWQRERGSSDEIYTFFFDTSLCCHHTLLRELNQGQFKDNFGEDCASYLRLVELSKVNQHQRMAAFVAQRILLSICLNLGVVRGRNLFPSVSLFSQLFDPQCFLYTVWSANTHIIRNPLTEHNEKENFIWVKIFKFCGNGELGPMSHTKHRGIRLVKIRRNE